LTLNSQPSTLNSQPCFMTAPRCFRFDGATHEGLKAAVRWRFGLVEATAFFRGHERVIDLADLTAAAGSILAVDRRIFTELGGFDPLYLPGRLEDLDFAYRGYLAGYHALYVPEALAYHRGMGTFGEVYGQSGCDLLALRNTLLFQWKNLRHPWHVARQAVGLPARLVLDVLRAAWVPGPRRFLFTRALVAALARVPQIARGRLKRSTSREREFFRRFHPRRMAEAPGAGRRGLATGEGGTLAAEPQTQALNPEPRTLNPICP
jgi:N-acetylglucosaminyl-diphospho-decaprenol L-rhamnosyltransferase